MKSKTRSLLASLVPPVLAFGLAACQPSSEATNTNANRSVNAPAATVAPHSSPPALAAGAPPVSAAHSSGMTRVPSAPAPGASTQSADADTSALDEKIAKAEAKARAPRASQADKLAAAEAYFERGYFYYSAQNPKLYRLALGDFRRSLRYQPDNDDARKIIAQIEGIYKSLGRPIPDNGLER